MFDLLAVAYQADLTRVFTFMMSRELSQRTYPQMGVAEPHHRSRTTATTRRRSPGTPGSTSTTRAVRQVREKLRPTPDGDGSLLDHSLIFYGGGMGNGNAHATDPLPLVAVGGGAGKGNRHILPAPGTPVGNLWLSVAEQVRQPDRQLRREHRAGRAVMSLACPQRRTTHRVAERTDAVSAEAFLHVHAYHGASVHRCVVMRAPGGAAAAGLAAAARDEPPLIDAVKAGDDDAIRQLREEPRGVNARGGRRHHRAALGGARRRCRDRAAAAARRRQTPRPPTATASRRCRWPPPTATPAMVETLLKAGADPNATLPEGETC